MFQNILVLVTLLMFVTLLCDEDKKVSEVEHFLAQRASTVLCEHGTHSCKLHLTFESTDLLH